MRPVRTFAAALLLSLAVLAAPAPARAQDGPRVALVVGNAAYPDSDAPLTAPLEDARALAAELQRRGFTVELGENLNRRALREAADRLLGKVEPGGTALVAFGGYGIQAGRQNYLIPVDAQIWSDADVQRDGLGLERLLAEIERKGAGAAYAIVDGAYRNPFERRFRSYSIGLAAVTPPANATVLLSAAPAAVLKQPGGRTSVFGAELVRQVAAAGGVTPEALTRTREAVTGRGEQAPAVFAALRDPAPPRETAAAKEPGPVSEIRPEPRPESPKEAAKPESKPESKPEARPETRPTQDRPTQEASVAARVPDPPTVDPSAEFRAAQGTGTRKAFEDFLGRHATGSFADLARLEIDRIDEAAREDARRAELAKRARAEPRVLPYAADEAKLRDELGARIARNADDGAALYRRGQLYAIHHDFPHALADFDQTIRLNPRDVEALNNRCWVRAITNDLDGALNDCNEALRLRPNFLDALDSRGFVNLKFGMPRRAVVDYDAALKVNAKHASALYGRGLARMRNGEAAEGKNDVTVALVLDPKVGEDFAVYGVK